MIGTGFLPQDTWCFPRPSPFRDLATNGRDTTITIGSVFQTMFAEASELEEAFPGPGSRQLGSRRRMGSGFK